MYLVQTGGFGSYLGRCVHFTWFNIGEADRTSTSAGRGFWLIQWSGDALLEAPGRLVSRCV